MLHSAIGSPRKIVLLPSQQETYEKLKAAAQASPYVVFAGTPGMGRTVLLKRFAEEIGAAFIGEAEVSAKLDIIDRVKVNEAIYDLVKDAMDEHGSVVVDDFFAFVRIGVGADVWWRGVKDGLAMALRDVAVKTDRVLVVGGNRIDPSVSPSEEYGESVTLIGMQSFAADDYAAFLTQALGNAVADVDFPLIYRAAPGLDAYQLELLGNLLRGMTRISNEDVLEVLERDILEARIRLDEVEALTFDGLPGSEEIAQALENHIILPFQNRQLADDLGIKPRRGVLLYGPPGTGKTSLGRALAHRMQGRFFLIDGNFVTEPPHIFFGAVEGIVREAKANAPSVLFIDDADVLFQIEHIAGLSRFLLSLLDGLESETSNNVCVVMTAMDAMKVPEALLRSGRVELWLETRAPDEATRAQIIERWLAGDMAELGDADCALIASETAGFTPADLRRLAGDAKLLYAADLVAKRPTGNATHYLMKATEELIATRAIMAKRLADDALLIRPYA